MLAHFGAIAEATHLPIIVYNIPGRTGVNMLPETIHELARRHPNIVGVKESSGNVEQFTALVRDRVREDFNVWSGDDYFYLARARARRARLHQRRRARVCSVEMRAMADAYDGGDIETAGRIHRDLQPLVHRDLRAREPDPDQVGDERVRLQRRRMPSADGADAGGAQADAASAHRAVPPGVIPRNPQFRFSAAASMRPAGTKPSR